MFLNQLDCLTFVSGVALKLGLLVECPRAEFGWKVCAAGIAAKRPQAAVCFEGPDLHAYACFQGSEIAQSKAAGAWSAPAALTSGVELVLHAFGRAEGQLLGRSNLDRRAG